MRIHSLKIASQAAANENHTQAIVQTWRSSKLYREFLEGETIDGFFVILQKHFDFDVKALGL